MGDAVRGRFAPSPSGRMHLGNVWTALLNWLCVRKAGGEVLLRIEDLDPDRCRREYAEALMDDLTWLGLDWDNRDVVWQSGRTEAYAALFDSLDARGLVYPCFCTRAERLAASAPHPGGESVYGGRCRDLSGAERAALLKLRRPAWRLRVPEGEIAFRDGCRGLYREDLPTRCGDFILRRSDGVYAYQLAVTADDAAAGVNLVVRGSDLLPSTPRQILLQRLLGLPTPAYFHVPLLLAPDGRRLSKRDGDLHMGVLRRRFTPEEILGALGTLAGLAQPGERCSLPELLDRFSPEKVPKKDVVVPENFLRT